MNFLKSIIREALHEILAEQQLDQNMETEADVIFINPQTKKEVKFQYDFLTARDKDLNKVFDAIKRKYPFIHEVDLGLNDELELLRQSKQNGTLTKTNNKLYLYTEVVNGDLILKATKNKNLAAQKKSA